MTASTIHHQLRRHRRKLLWTLAVLAVLTVAATAKTALMSPHGHGEASDAAVVCVTLGACLAVIGVGVVGVRRLLRRPLWAIREPLAPLLPFVPAVAGFRVRAGPSPSLLQVFRF